MKTSTAPQPGLVVADVLASLGDVVLVERSAERMKFFTDAVVAIAMTLLERSSTSATILVTSPVMLASYLYLFRHPAMLVGDRAALTGGFAAAIALSALYAVALVLALVVPASTTWRGSSCCSPGRCSGTGKRLRARSA